MEILNKTKWIKEEGVVGKFLFTLDNGKTVYNLFQDFPEKLSRQELELFCKENPHWADFFGIEL